MFSLINKAIASFVGAVVAISFLVLTWGLIWLFINPEIFIDYFDLTGEWATYAVGITTFLYAFFVFQLGGLAVHTANYYQIKELKTVLEDLRDGRNAYNSDPEANRKANRVDPSL